ncbi:hypothetical protein MVEN_02322500 [Mycena venus]|uniref:Uncharacterized protein n=1 Tax=Mycena venus TaxID=2733690 RepID=A0A8H7CE17_9AGAR|nr:hypothetical protein MVEN_02322500 [Mycena venus]
METSHGQRISDLERVLCNIQRAWTNVEQMERYPHKTFEDRNEHEKVESNEKRPKIVKAQSKMEEVEPWEVKEKQGFMTPRPKQKTGIVVNISDDSDGESEEIRVQEAVKASSKVIASRGQTGIRMQGKKPALNAWAANEPKPDKGGVLSQDTDFAVDVEDFESNGTPQLEKPVAPQTSKKMQKDRAYSEYLIARKKWETTRTQMKEQGKRFGWGPPPTKPRLATRTQPRVLPGEAENANVGDEHKHTSVDDGASPSNASSQQEGSDIGLGFESEEE